MSDYLTPAELDGWADELERTYPPDNKLAPTLRAYADVVEGVARDPFATESVENYNTGGEVWYCHYCDGDEFTHSPDCLWLRARQLAGHE